jgi:hypothetical protein
MAQFKQLTFHSTTDRISVNLDQVRYMQSYPDYTVIHFSEEHRITVKETIAQITAA